MNIKAQVEATQPRKLHEIAKEIRQDWKAPYFGAVPYMRAMETMDELKCGYGQDSGESIVLYFLSNAQTWKGETARKVKAELKELLKAAK